MHIIQGPGPWQVFVKRPDNVGLNVMEVKSKYLTEQLLYENTMFSLLSTTAPTAPASSAAVAAGAITKIAGPGLSAKEAKVVEKQRNEEKKRIPTPTPKPKPPVVETYNLITQGSDNIITQDSDTIIYQ